MSEVTVHAAVKHFGSTSALAGVDLTVPEGSLTAVLGPSGCGKTTLLRCIAGFERLDGGSITIDGQTVAADRTHVAPQRRRVVVVPQEGALFPHLSVAGNVSYGLDRAARRSGRVEEVLALVGLAGYGDRMPHQLSGGQQQRVAVARALAPRPSLVLLDEPFSALDAGLRTELRHDIRAALRADRTTAVLVTHDQGEALSTADQIAVMRAGRLVQAGPPDTVYRAPVDPWVAAFVGDAVLLPGTVDGGGVSTSLGRIPVPEVPAAGVRLTVLVRPEQVRITRRLATVTALAAAGVPAPPGAAGAPAPPGAGGVPATVVGQEFHGHDALVALRLADGTGVTARVLGTAEPVEEGTAVELSVTGQGWAYPGAAEPPAAGAAVRPGPGEATSSAAPAPVGVSAAPAPAGVSAGSR